MGRRREQAAAVLRELAPSDWPGYLRERSGLPGPRADLELVQAVADVAPRAVIDTLLDTDDEYLVLCGVVALGRLLAEGDDAVTTHADGRADDGLSTDRDDDVAERLRRHASGRADDGQFTDGDDDVAESLRRHAGDARWRVREGVAMALQRLGDADLDRLAALADAWAGDPDPLVQRAAVAGLCEPRLLTTPAAAARAVAVCATVTGNYAALPPGRRKADDAKALRRALAYCWSVAVAADRAAGMPRFLELDSAADKDLAWIVKENRGKARMR